MDKPHICIVGGGVIGIACAYYLSQYDCRITLVDKQKLGKETSYGNCGLIHRDSHILPLPHPGAIKAALKMLFTQGRLSPLYIKPSLSLDLWKWFWHFRRNCQPACLDHNIVARCALIDSSYQLYRELFEQNLIPYQWHQTGSLKVFRNPDLLAQTKLLYESFAQYQIACEWLDAHQVKELEPSCKDDVIGGCFFARDASLQPDLLLAAWITVLKNQGVHIRENCTVTSLHYENNMLTEVDTHAGVIKADQFVFTLGAFTPHLKKQLPFMLPIQPGKGYSLSLSYTTPRIKIPIAFPEHNVVITPMDDFYRIGSIVEFVGYNKTLVPGRFTQLKNSAALYLNHLSENKSVEAWCGLRSMTPDGLPFIGAYPQIQNLYLAAGHNMEGLTMAPATGKLIAELVMKTPPHIEITPYRLNRFR